MKLSILSVLLNTRFFDNSGLEPTVWAQQALMYLENMLVMPQLVHRDYEDMIAAYGAKVTAHRPSVHTTNRRVRGDTITPNATSATTVDVILDQWAYDSFVIYDDELSKSLPDLFELNLKPSVSSIANFIEAAMLAQAYQFKSNNVGQLGTAVTQTLLAQADAKCITQKFPSGDPRFMMLAPNCKAGIMGNPALVTADKVGDAGSRLRDASIGSLLGFQMLTSNHVPSIASGVNTTVTGAVNYASGYGIGTTVLTVDGFSAAITNGAWCVIAGDGVPQMITATSGGSTPTQLTITPGLRRAVENNAVITVYTPGAINLGAGYAANWAKAMTINGFTVAPLPQQMISLGDDANALIHAGMNTPTTTSMLLDRPIASGVANSSVVGVGPAGDYNFAFHRNAMAFVHRPLALPPPAYGAVVKFNDLSIRLVMQYDTTIGGTIVTLDLLFGVAVLDTDLGCLMFT